MLTETNLDEGVKDAELFSNQYTVYRGDRCSLNSHKQSGGGVLIAISTAHKSYRIYPPCSSIEDLWIVVSSRHGNIILGTYYIPPASGRDIYESFFSNFEYVLTKFKCRQCIVAGDYNVRSGGSHAPILLSEYCAFLNIKQVNTVTNCFLNTLDFIFVYNSELSVYEAECPLVPIDMYHPALNFDVPVEVLFSMNRKNYTPLNPYNFYKTDFELANNLLLAVDWDVLDRLDVDEAVGTFYNIVGHIICHCVPLKRSRVSRFPHWFSGTSINLINRKNRLYKKYKKSLSNDFYAEYCSLRAESKSSIKRDYRQYIASVETSCNDNLKSFWHFVKNKKNVMGYPTSMKHNDSVISEDLQISDTFASFFEETYSRGSLPTPPLDTSLPFFRLLSNFAVDGDMVLKKLLSLRADTGPGPDGIAPIFLKRCAQSLYKPIVTIFNKSLTSGIVPDFWKRSFIIPIFKAGDKTEISNYRPICILSALSKLLESFVSDLIFSHFKTYICEHQHGFYRGRSTVTNLMVYKDFLINNLEKGLQIDSVYTDIQKAFDSVPHDHLINKLDAMGIHGQLLKWINSFISNRTLKVNFRGNLSKNILATSGVPQGSHLGPLLFLLFFNDVVNCFQYSHVLLYADDLKVYKCISSINDCHLLQKDLDAFALWCRSNGVTVNTRKCKVITFTKRKSNIDFTYIIDDVPLDRVNSISDLGVIFDTDCNFSMHIDAIVNRSLKILGFLKRNMTDFLNVNVIKLAYSSCVRSILEYANLIWIPQHQYQRNALERVQRKFVKYLIYRMGLDWSSTPYEVCLEKCGLVSLEARLQRASFTFLSRLFNNQYQCGELLSQFPINVPSRKLRHYDFFREAPHRTNYGSSGSVSFIISTFNSHFADNNLF